MNFIKKLITKIIFLMSKPTPKFPHNLAVVDRADSSSTGIDRDRQFPIMSVSKSFCGAVSALMAVDGKFGDNGLGATLGEVLDVAEKSHLDRSEQISVYRRMLTKKEIADVRLSELLNHTSGIAIHGHEDRVAYAGKPVSKLVEERFSKGTDRGTHRYSNHGYTLMEEMINLTSKSGSYEQELQTRVFDKCDMTYTGDLNKSREALKRVGQVVLKAGMVDPLICPPGKVATPEMRVASSCEFDPVKENLLGRVALSNGGLSSTMTDMEKYSVELAKMVTGQPSLLTDSLAQTSQQISRLYTEHTHAGSHYSLGILTDKNGKGETILEHSGMFPANDSNMRIVVSPDGSSITPQIFMEQKDWLAQSILNREVEIPAQILRDYYNSKLTEEERLQHASSTPKVIRTFLTEQGRLPENFKTEIVDPIETAFRGSMRGFLTKNYLTPEGVVDSVRLVNNFETNGDIDRAVEPYFIQGKEEARKFLEKSERLLADTQRENYYLSQKDGKTITPIPSEVYFDDGAKLTFCGRKEKGWSVGGWYKTEEGQKFLIKFGDEAHIENMLNHLAIISVGEEYAVKTAIGHADLEGKNRPFFAVAEIKDYKDMIDIKDLAIKKSHAPKFHPFYVFAALIANDDLNEENFGLINQKSPIAIDYGMVPRFLHPEQIEYAHLPVTLASFIGHRNLNGMQFVRRRYFGHDQFLLPEPFKLQKFEPEDISYGSILLGAKRIIENKDQILAAIPEYLQKLAEDTTIPNERKDQDIKKFSSFAKIMSERIAWMEENFKEDLSRTSDPEMLQKFNKMKWRLMPEFTQLMQIEEEIFKKCAKTDLDKNFAILAGDFLEKQTGEKRSRAEILDLDLKNVETSDVKDFLGKNFMLHDALIAGDFELVKWLSNNDLVDVNSNRTTRNHNYQYFRLTPLHTAISIYHDKLYYGQKSDLEPLEEMIDVLQEKFFEKNGKISPGDFSPVGLTYAAYENFTQKASKQAVAATTIQRRGFRTAERLKPDSNELEKK